MKRMTIYFYHTQDTGRILREWREGLYPGHLLYGAAHLPQQGVEVIPHLYPPMHEAPRWQWTLLTTWRILKCRKRYDVLYATSFRGLEGIVLLRALRLFRHPVVLWHHQPIVTARNKWRERMARLFYRGIDFMFFFSRPLLEESLKSRKARPERMRVVPWGADLAFYDRILRQTAGQPHHGFVSTGKEQRDLPTLVSAFAALCGKSSDEFAPELQLYINSRTGRIDYSQILGNMQIPSNVQIHPIHRLMIGELAAVVARARCVVICCLPTNYTVGLTTLVEALALGLPVICSRNVTFPLDVEAEGAGLTVDYGDVEGWTRAVHYVMEHPAEAAAMGRRGRELADRTFNIDRTTRVVAEVLEHIKSARKH